jgi:hypothetical protein
MPLTHQQKLERMARSGLCTQCNRVPTRTGKILCENCARQAVLKRKERFLEKHARGFCASCPLPTSERKDGKHYRFCDKCRTARNAHMRELREPRRIYMSKLRKQWWNLIFTHYGDICVCCGESDKTFLTLDHINNDGAAHRKAITGQPLQWVIKHDYPKTLQILCYNCNCAKQRVGICPHEAYRRRAALRAV